MGGTAASRGARVAVLAGHLAIVGVLLAGDRSVAQDRSVGFDQSATARVLRFSREHERLIDGDAPALEIYGDGRVVAHRPPHMLEPGDYEWRLNPGELQQLLNAFAADGLLEYDSEDVERQKRDFAQKEAREGRAWAVSDATVTTLEVDFASYEPGGGKAPVGRVRKVIRGHNFQLDAEHMSGLTALGGMARIERRLLQLEKQAVGRGWKF